jgi:hypothetical protein
MEPSLTAATLKRQEQQQQQQQQPGLITGGQQGWLKAPPEPATSADALLKFRVPPVLESLVRSVERGRLEGQLGSKLPVKMDPER